MKYETDYFCEQIFIAYLNKAISPSHRTTPWRLATGCDTTIRTAEATTRFAALEFPYRHRTRNDRLRSPRLAQSERLFAVALWHRWITRSPNDGEFSTR